MNEEPADDVLLMPCPHCGGDADVSEGTQGPDQRPWWYVECIKCSASAESVEAWNARHSSSIVALRAIEQILSGRQPIDVPGALMVARSALGDQQ